MKKSPQLTVSKFSPVVQTFLGVVFIYLLTFVNIEISPFDIPITGQSLAVLVVAYVLPRYWGALSVAIYVIIGVLGFPVFANGASGLVTLQGNSGGYIYGFILTAWVISFWKKRSGAFHLINVVIGMLIGTALILFFGFIHLSFLIGTKKALVYGVQPFLLGGIIKSVVGALLVWLWKKVKR